MSTLRLTCSWSKLFLSITGLREMEILLSESSEFAPAALRVLEQLGRVTLAELDRPQLLRSVSRADVLWIRLRHKIDAEVLSAAPHLRAVVSPTTGLNHIDLKEAERRGIRVLSLRGEDTFLKDVRGTAEHTVALILALLRRLPDAVSHVRDAGWERNRFRGNELYGKTVGIVGFGRLGRLVARYLRVYGTRLLATDVRPMVVPGSVKLVSLPKLLRHSDIVTMHADLSPTSVGFFGAEQFAHMKPGTWFINTARGELVDEDALLQALQSSHLAGAAVDVISEEHSIGNTTHPLIAYSRTNSHLIITPHIGGCTHESMEKTEVFMAKKLSAFCC